MKNREVPIQYDESLDVGQAEMTTIMDGKPFVIRGDEAIVNDLASELVQQTGRVVVRSALEGANKPLEAVTSKVTGLLGEVATSVGLEARTAVYDLVNGTNFRQALHEQRQLRRDTAYAQKIGLLSVEPCAKHRKAMQAVQSLR